MKPTEALKQYLALVEEKKAVDESVEIAKQVLMDAMQKDGQLSMKTADATVSIAKRVTPQVNELEFRRWVEDNPSVPLDSFYDRRLNNKMVAEFSNKWKKDTGEIVPYLAFQETEYLTVKQAKSE